MNDFQLYKPNELISVISQMELTRTARHLFNYFLKFAQNKIKLEDYSGTSFKININELNELADIRKKNNAYIEKVLRTLMQPIKVVNDPKHYIYLTPVTEIVVNVETGEYIYSLQDKVINLLRQIDYFTKLNLDEFNPLKSKYSIVIYEYLKQYEKLEKIRTITIDELRKITDTTSKYKQFTDFEQRVIRTAVNEINAYTQNSCTYELIRTRSKRKPIVTAIQFYFSKKKEETQSKSIYKNIQEEQKLYKQVFLDKNSLYYEFLKFAPTLEKHVYIRSTYTYRESTLKAFLFSIQKNQNYLNSQTYMQWLEDRTNNKNIYKNYLRMTMPFNAKEVILKFKEAAELVLKREFTQDEINQINDLLGYFDFYEYGVLVKKFETLFNQLVPTNSYNPFSKMIERNA